MKPHINITNEIGQNHGLWIVYNYNGSVCYKGQYINGIRHGYWIDNYFINNPQIILYLK